MEIGSQTLDPYNIDAGMNFLGKKGIVPNFEIDSVFDYQNRITNKYNFANSINHLSFFQEIYKSSLSFAGYTVSILKEMRTVQ